MNELVQDRKWWAKALMIGGVVALVLLPLGALGSRVGIWPFTGGFMLLAVGVVLATIVFFLGIVGAVYANAKGRLADRKDCLIGLALSVLIIAIMLPPFLGAFSVPAIHNISTDTLDPPQFNKIAAIREAQEGINPLQYPADNIPLQQQAYPAVKPLISQAATADMLARAQQVVEELGMEVVNADTSLGIVEATDTTFWFGFKDDVVIRVRGESGGSVVDVRSVSRVGQSDLGKNAQRIGLILAGLQQD